MKDEAGQHGEHEGFSRQDLYGDYRSCYLQLGAEVRPCRDPGLLKRAGQFLLRKPDLKDTFTVFPFYQAVTERCGDGTDSRKHLAAFIKATEMLETLCINMFLQPWKKEIRSLKTFTGAFVYCLQPVLSSATIQAVLACIGYLPKSDASPSEFTLSCDADADQALLLGFELLLARLECYHLLELLVEHQLGPQEWLDVLQRRKQTSKLKDPTEQQMTLEQRKDNNEKKAESQYFESRPPSVPQPKLPRHHPSVDQADMELQWPYPDLAFRGRPLLPEQPHRAPPTMTSSVTDGTSVLSKTNLMKESKAASPTVFSRDDGCNDKNSVGVFAPADTRTSDDDDPPSGPQAISLHLTLRTGAKAESSRRRGRIQPTTDCSDDTQQKPDRENVMSDKPESSCLSSTDEEQQLRELAERMGQLCVQAGQEKTKGKDEDVNREGHKHDKPKQWTNL
ncbi:uncharacterized protein FYW61_010637 isoform 1-T2 [Anableps anableps]